jgi:hypothetical protein
VSGVDVVGIAGRARRIPGGGQNVHRGSVLAYSGRAALCGGRRNRDRRLREADAVRPADRSSGANYFLPLLLCLFVESIMFSVTLLAARIGWGWLAGMTVVGASNLFLAYMLEMEIADKA